MSDILNPEMIRVPGTARDRDGAIREAGQILVDAGAVTQGYIDAIFQREELVSTYMGNFLAIPHGTNEAAGHVYRSALSVVKYDRPIDWDGHEVRFAVGVAGYEGGHLEVLSKIAIVFSDEAEVRTLLQAGTADQLYGLLDAVMED